MGVEVQVFTFLTLALDGVEWLSSILGHFTLRKRTPSTCWIGVSLDLRVSLDAVAKRKIPSPAVN